MNRILAKAEMRSNRDADVLPHDTLYVSTRHEKHVKHFYKMYKHCMACGNSTEISTALMVSRFPQEESRLVREELKIVLGWVAIVSDERSRWGMGRCV